MLKIKLDITKRPAERIALAKKFLLEQTELPKNQKAFQRMLNVFAKQNTVSLIRKDELLYALKDLPENYTEMWHPFCKKGPVRSTSGVAVLSLLTRNFGCPARCTYCPTPAGMPKSYLPNEPAVLRAIDANFSPKKQITNRLTALKNTGHDTSKTEIIVLGGTWSSHPVSYKQSYIRACYNALNAQPGRVKSLAEEQRINETAAHRCVGLTLETRPDWINEKEIRQMRTFGCTRVEIGVQTLYDEVQKLTKRGHGLKEAAEATRLLRNAGFKVVYHMMLNLPGSTPEMDIAMFKQLFEDPRFCPDQMKVYPCMLIKGTELMKTYKSGDWVPYTDEQLINTILGLKQYVPEYCRIIRVIRDIPSTDIVAGSHASNLRESVHRRKQICRCVRCREIRNEQITEATLITREYDTVGGKEVFLSYEDTKLDKLIGLLRLRLPNTDETFLFETLKNAALVRELHVYGLHTPIGDASKNSQHKGFGKKLITEAERIAKQQGYATVAIIAGVGVREYYRKLGYENVEGYMVKELDS
jgi:elongator complex protein 3